MPNHSISGKRNFPTTSWTLVLNAASPGIAEGRAALAALCECYWYPLYAFVRRRGYPREEARDLTQDFFLRILEGRYLDRADPQKGRFRTFLLTSFHFFLSDEFDRARALKRGGCASLPFEITSGEERFEREPREEETPERIYERRWALSVLERAMNQLRREFDDHGRTGQFERLKGFLIAGSEEPYAALAREMGTSEGALKVSIHRLRKRYRELFRNEIASTVADPADVEPEVRFLVAALSR
ncbi:MAG: RNA polymerase sigma factor [Bryobacteraceae bacterium]